MESDNSCRDSGVKSFRGCHGLGRTLDQGTRVTPADFPGATGEVEPAGLDEAPGDGFPPLFNSAPRPRPKAGLDMSGRLRVGNDGQKRFWQAQPFNRVMTCG